MKHISYIIAALTVVCCVSACQEKKNNPTVAPNAELTEAKPVADTTVYGKVIDGGQSVLQLQTDTGDTIEYVLETPEGESVSVLGGYNVGDRLAIIATKFNGENLVTKAINLLSLQGHWTSLDKNFTIEEDGTVKSDVKAESNPWTSWKILNGKLLLNKQAFDIDQLGSDSLALEDSTGIYVFKRQK